MVPVTGVLSADSVVQVLEHLPSKCEDLSSKLNTAKKKKNQLTGVLWFTIISVIVLRGLLLLLSSQSGSQDMITPAPGCSLINTG
jgi:hypothetical protein